MRLGEHLAHRRANRLAERQGLEVRWCIGGMPREREKLSREIDAAFEAAAHVLGCLLAPRVGSGSLEHLHLHLKRGERRQQLVGGVRDENLLRAKRCVQAREKLIHRGGHRQQLCRQRFERNAIHRIVRASIQLCSEARERAQATLHEIQNRDDQYRHEQQQR